MGNLYENYRGSRVKVDELDEKYLKNATIIAFLKINNFDYSFSLGELKSLKEKYYNKLNIIIVNYEEIFEEHFERISIYQKEVNNVKGDFIFDFGGDISEKFEINDYPSFILIDNEGFAFGEIRGIENIKIIDRLIEDTIIYFNGSISDIIKDDDLIKKFPKKISVGDRIYASDPINNKILVYDKDIKFLFDIGSGNKGLKDGNYSEANFNHPLGIFVNGDFLYVADTLNHEIREINLIDKYVKTIAGNGELEYNPIAKGLGIETKLYLPQDIEVIGDYLYIAMAGNNQIWELNLVNNKIISLAGTGYDPGSDCEIKNGLYEKSSLSKPISLSYDGGHIIYFVEYKGKTLRYLNMQNEVVESMGMSFENIGEVKFYNNKKYIYEVEKNRIISIDDFGFVEEIIKEDKFIEGIDVFENILYYSIDGKIKRIFL